MKQEVPPSETTTRSVKRAADVLRVLSRSVAGCNLTRVAHEAALSKATAYRLLQTLAAEGFVDFSDKSGSYTIGTELVRITMAARRSSKLMAIQEFERLSAAPMRSLCDDTGETVALVIQQGEKRTNVAVCLGSHELIAAPKVGAQLPVQLGGPGKLILAFAPPIASCAEVAHAPRLEAELQQIRVAGYATSLGEAVEGQASIAAPIFRHGTFLAALNLIVPTVRFDESKKIAFVPRVKQAARDIGRLAEGALNNEAFDWE